jgi:predicted RNA-binding Zn ribbon-like protein
MDLPHDLTLPLRSGQPYWYWLGGRPAVDFANTLRERWWRNVETLVTPDDLVAWLTQAGLIDPALSARATRARLLAARQLREAIDVGIVAVIAGEDVPVPAVRTIDGWLAAGMTGQTLERGPDRELVLSERTPADRVEHALGRIALDAAALLGSAQRERVRICASPTCSARFYDRSPTGGRRWCSMRGCGNVAKARRHRARVRAS